MMFKTFFNRSQKLFKLSTKKYSNKRVLEPGKKTKLKNLLKRIVLIQKQSMLQCKKIEKKSDVDSMSVPLVSNDDKHMTNVFYGSLYGS